VNRLDATSPIPGPGWAFRIHALHTSDTGPPYLTGTWHQGGAQVLEPGCALSLMLAARAGGEVDLAVFADHEQIPDIFTPIARYTHLPPGMWMSTVVPVIAAHPYVTWEHDPGAHGNRHRAARAILAYLITHN
jgi:hypothetical protein